MTRLHSHESLPPRKVENFSLADLMAGAAEAAALCAWSFLMSAISHTMYLRLIVSQKLSVEAVAGARARDEVERWREALCSYI